jgi:hypothetical protein
MDRRSFLQAASLLPAGVRAAVSQQYDEQPAGRLVDSAYLQAVVPTGQADTLNTPYRGIVTRDGWKYVCFEGRSWLQFNLNDDPYEEMNVAQLDRYKPERKKLIDRLKQWDAETGDRFAVPED